MSWLAHQAQLGLNFSNSTKVASTSYNFLQSSGLTGDLNRGHKFRTFRITSSMKAIIMT